MEGNKKRTSSMFQTSSSKSPLVVIVGETGSGKSALAMELAQKFDGEIICADSRTIYKGMDIGTAKPTLASQKLIPHHLLDIIEPDKPFNVADFKILALRAIDKALSKGKLPILVGGTGLYIDSVLFDYDFSPPGARRSLHNPRHLKYQENTAYKKGLRPNSLAIGLSKPKNIISSSIEQRLKNMIDNGLLKEVEKIVRKCGWEAPGLNTIGYREFKAYFAGTQTLQETAELINRNTILYAKRQRTWFKRNKSIQWLDDPSRAVDLVTTFLNT